MQNFTNSSKNILYSSHFKIARPGLCPQTVSFIFFNLDQSLGLPSSFQVWKVPGQMFYRLHLSFSLSVVFSWLDSQSLFLDDVFCNWCLSSVNHFRRHMMTVCLITDVNFDHWLRWYAAGFPIKWPLPLFPVTKKKPEGDNFKTK